MPVRHQVDLPDGPASYLEWLPQADPRGTVVLLHGGGLDSAELSWGDFGGRLADGGYRVLAPDAPGYGNTPLPAWPSTQEKLVRVAGAFVDALDLDGFVLGGISMGGGMTLGYALEHPGRVRAIIPVCTAGIMDRQRDGWVSGAFHLTSWLSLHSGLLDAGFRMVAASRPMLRWSLAQIISNPARLTPALLDAAMAEAARPSGSQAFGQWQRDQILRDRIRTNYLPRVGELTMPALVVHAERDVGVPVQRARELAAALPHCRLVVVPDAGHWVVRDAPDEVATEVLDFLASLEPAGPQAS